MVFLGGLVTWSMQVSSWRDAWVVQRRGLEAQEGNLTWSVLITAIPTMYENDQFYSITPCIYLGSQSNIEFRDMH